MRGSGSGDGLVEPRGCEDRVLPTNHPTERNQHSVRVSGDHSTCVKSSRPSAKTNGRQQACAVRRGRCTRRRGTRYIRLPVERNPPSRLCCASGRRYGSTAATAATAAAAAAVVVDGGPNPCTSIKTKPSSLRFRRRHTDRLQASSFKRERERESVKEKTPVTIYRLRGYS